MRVTEQMAESEATIDRERERERGEGRGREGGSKRAGERTDERTTGGCRFALRGGLNQCEGREGGTQPAQYGERGKEEREGRIGLKRGERTDATNTRARASHHHHRRRRRRSG